jgi:uncharacterized membrane-anchored protein
MIKFIRQMLGSNGEISSKRSMMVFFSLLFAYALISNHVTGKQVDDTMKWQLFGLLIWIMSLVYGEKLPEIFTAWFGRKTEIIKEEKREEKKEVITNEPK